MTDLMSKCRQKYFELFKEFPTEDKLYEFANGAGLLVLLENDKNKEEVNKVLQSMIKKEAL